MRVALTKDALADLKEVGRWIAQENPERAGSFVRELREACSSLGRHPERFPLALGSGSGGIRKRVHHGYLLLYRVRAEQVDVLRVVHGSREWAALLRDEV